MTRLPRPTLGDWAGGVCLAIWLVGMLFLPLIFGG